MAKRDELERIRRKIEKLSKAYHTAKEEARKIDRARRERDLERERKRAGSNIGEEK
jgi:hypothetical protein